MRRERWRMDNYRDMLAFLSDVEFLIFEGKNSGDGGYTRKLDFNPDRAEKKNILRLPGTDPCLPFGVTNYFDASRDTETPLRVFCSYRITLSWKSLEVIIISRENFGKKKKKRKLKMNRNNKK